jgi:site-specific recombinase XerD
MLEDMQIRNFSPSTQKAYISAMARFAKHFGRPPDQLGPEEIRAYQIHLREEKHLGWGAFNTVVSAQRFFYRTTLGKDWRMEFIPYPRAEHRLPVVLSIEEVERFLGALPSLRQRAMLITAYAAGLRISEVARLQVEDIDSKRMVIRIRQSKGHKDRYVMLSPRLLKLLRIYWKAAHPQEWLFAGRHGEGPISTRGIAWICEQARLASGLSKHVTMHTLRHASA